MGSGFRLRRPRNDGSSDGGWHGEPGGGTGTDRQRRCAARSRRARCRGSWRWRRPRTGRSTRARSASRDLGGGTAMTLDTVFRIASMTKAITSRRGDAAGRGRQAQPRRHAARHRSDAERAAGARRASTPDGAPRLRPAKRPITLKHLLTHTAGFTYEMWNADTARYVEAGGTPPRDVGPARGVAAAARLRPRRALGIRHQHRLDRPPRRGGQRAAARRLSAASTSSPRSAWWIPASCRPGAARAAGQRASARGRRQPGAAAASPPPSTPEFFAGGGGLYSTGRDYLRFLRNAAARRQPRRRPRAAAGNRRADEPEPYRRPAGRRAEDGQRRN